jgi:hypothetical protein
VGDRLGRAVEVASVVLIGCSILLFGWPLLQNLARFRLASSLVLGLLGMLQLAALRRNVAAGGPAAGVRATRDLAFLAAIAFALVEVLAPARWAIGACISAVLFAIVLELLARLTPAPPAAD